MHQQTKASSLDWIYKASLTGSCYGLAGTAISQAFLIGFGEPEGDISFYGVLIGEVFAAINVAFTYISCAFVSAAALWPVTRIFCGTYIASLIHAAIITSLSLFHGISIFIYLKYKLYPIPSSVSILADSATQLLSEVYSLYPLIAAGVGLLSVTICGVYFLSLIFFLSRATSVNKLHIFFIVSISTLYPIAATKISRLPYTRSHFNKIPELALLSSFQMIGPIDNNQTLPVPAQGALVSHSTRWEDLALNASIEKPNFLLVQIDSISSHHVGYQGYHRNVTPTIDALASRSLKLSRAWSTSSHSHFAQMAVLSSQWPRRREHGDLYEQLDYPRILPQDIFYHLGYKTATISSQNEAWSGMLKFQSTKTPHVVKHSPDYPGEKIGWGGESKLFDHVTIDMAIDWLKTGEKKPWALYLNLQATHFPYSTPPTFPAIFQPTNWDNALVTFFGYDKASLPSVLNRYDNALRYVDSQMGRLLSHLETSGQHSNTLIVITSDHGEAFLHEDGITHGKTLLEREVRSPLLFYWPKRLPPQTITTPVSHLDIMPTVLDILDLSPHPGFQGASFLNPSRLASKRPAIFLTMQGLRKADAIICWPWKAILDHTGGTSHLYNLARDSKEKVDLIDKQKDRAKILLGILEAQVAAQLEYYNSSEMIRTTHFPPQLLSCPDDFQSWL